MMTRRREKALFGQDTSRKLIAIMTTAALVASLGYFHLWGSISAEAFGDEDQVEISFNFDESAAQIIVDDETVAPGQPVETSVASDFLFTIAPNSDYRIDQVTASTLAPVAPPQEDEGPEEPSDSEIGSEDNELVSDDQQSDESDDEPSSSEDAVQSDAIEIVKEPAPIPETAAILQARDKANVVKVGGEETVEDDQVPMADEPDSIADDSATELMVITVVYNSDNGEYRILQEDLKKVASFEGTIEVKIESSEEPQGCSTWDDLEKFLAEEGQEGEIKLESNLDAERPVTVRGAKTLDLNGWNITANFSGDLFSVGDEEGPSTFTITDSKIKYNELRKVLPTSGLPLDKPSEENAGDLKRYYSENNNDYLGYFRQAVGRTASLEGNILTYYIAESHKDPKQVGATNEYQLGYEIDMSDVGSVISDNPTASDASSVVLLANPKSTICIKGGRLSATGGDAHAVNMNKGGTLEMTDGFITNSTTIGHGAAITANNTDTKENINITIAGYAVIAGNHASKNGGAIWVRSIAESPQAQITVKDNALIAGNVAGDKIPTGLDEGKYAEVGNGGGIFADRNCAVNISGDAVVAGNTAKADGGGIYIKGRTDDETKSSLTIEGNAYITNNRSENDRSAVHPTDRSADNHPAKDSDDFWKNAGGGGGGIFTLDETTINGGQITANFASDGGGGIFAVGGIQGYKYPLLKIENCLISSNYAGTSEGGGINAATLKESYIKQGYITNNMTATYYDYGGGGLFLSSADHGTTTGMTVYYPLVTNNTAKGLGGGVALCTNGIVLSSEAAVYDNKALWESATENPNEYGDQWLLELNLHAGEKPIPEGSSRYGLKDNIDKTLANDFFCAKESTVSNQMLGGGCYNWKGYTDGSAVAGTATMKRVAWEDDKTASFNGGTPITIGNIFYESEKGHWTMHAPNDIGEIVADLQGYQLNYNTVDASIKNGNSYEPIAGSGLITKVTKVGDSTLANQTEFQFEVDLTRPYGYAEVGKEQEQKILKDASTRTESSQSYTLHEIRKLPEDGRITIHGDRLTFLTADPNPIDRQKAEAKAVLFFNGNYSNTHGAGIACNDKITIGANPEKPWEPSLPESGKGSLSITKEMSNFQEGTGTATAVFEITGYTDKSAKLHGLADQIIYRNTIGFTFEENGSSQKTLENLPEGYYVVKEIYYSGDNFNPSTNNSWEGEVKAGDHNRTDFVAEPVEISFTNSGSETDESFSTGVVNSYEPQKNDKGELVYVDGKLTYTPDENYRNRKEPVAPVEGEE